MEVLMENQRTEPVFTCGDEYGLVPSLDLYDSPYESSYDFFDFLWKDSIQVFADLEDQHSMRTHENQVPLSTEKTDLENELREELENLHLWLTNEEGFSSNSVTTQNFTEPRKVAQPEENKAETSTIFVHTPPTSDEENTFDKSLRGFIRELFPFEDEMSDQVDFLEIPWETSPQTSPSSSPKIQHIAPTSTTHSESENSLNISETSTLVVSDDLQSTQNKVADEEFEIEYENPPTTNEESSCEIELYMCECCGEIFKHNEKSTKDHKCQDPNLKKRHFLEYVNATVSNYTNHFIETVKSSRQNFWPQKEEGQGRFECLYCVWKTFTTKKALRQHMHNDHGRSLIKKTGHGGEMPTEGENFLKKRKLNSGFDFRVQKLNPREKKEVRKSQETSTLIKKSQTAAKAKRQIIIESSGKDEKLTNPSKKGYFCKKCDKPFDAKRWLTIHCAVSCPLKGHRCTLR